MIRIIVMINKVWVYYIILTLYQIEINQARYTDKILKLNQMIQNKAIENVSIEDKFQIENNILNTYCYNDTQNSQQSCEINNTKKRKHFKQNNSTSRSIGVLFQNFFTNFLEGHDVMDDLSSFLEGHFVLNSLTSDIKQIKPKKNNFKKLNKIQKKSNGVSKSKLKKLKNVKKKSKIKLSNSKSSSDKKRSLILLLPLAYVIGSLSKLALQFAAFVTLKGMALVFLIYNYVSKSDKKGDNLVILDGHSKSSKLKPFGFYRPPYPGYPIETLIAHKKPNDKMPFMLYDPLNLPLAPPEIDPFNDEFHYIMPNLFPDKDLGLFGNDLSDPFRPDLTPLEASLSSQLIKLQTTPAPPIVIIPDILKTTPLPPSPVVLLSDLLKTTTQSPKVVLLPEVVDVQSYKIQRKKPTITVSQPIVQSTKLSDGITSNITPNSVITLEDILNGKVKGHQTVHSTHSLDNILNKYGILNNQDHILTTTPKSSITGVTFTMYPPKPSYNTNDVEPINTLESIEDSYGFESKNINNFYHSPESRFFKAKEGLNGTHYSKPNKSFNDFEMNNRSMTVHIKDTDTSSSNMVKNSAFPGSSYNHNTNALHEVPAPNLSPKYNNFFQSNQNNYSISSTSPPNFSYFKQYAKDIDKPATSSMTNPDATPNLGALNITANYLNNLVANYISSNNLNTKPSYISNSGVSPSYTNSLDSKLNYASTNPIYSNNYDTKSSYTNNFDTRSNYLNSASMSPTYTNSFDSRPSYSSNIVDTRLSQTSNLGVSLSHSNNLDSRPSYTGVGLTNVNSLDTRSPYTGASDSRLGYINTVGTNPSLTNSLGTRATYSGTTGSQPTYLNSLTQAPNYANKIFVGQTNTQSANTRPTYTTGVLNTRTNNVNTAPVIQPFGNRPADYNILDSSPITTEVDSRPGYVNVLNMRPGYTGSLNLRPGYVSNVDLKTAYINGADSKLNYANNIKTNPIYNTNSNLNTANLVNSMTRPNYGSNPYSKPVYGNNVYVRPNYLNYMDPASSYMKNLNSTYTLLKNLNSTQGYIKNLDQIYNYIKNNLSPSSNQMKNVDVATSSSSMYNSAIPPFKPSPNNVANVIKVIQAPDLSVRPRKVSDGVFGKINIGPRSLSN